MGREHLMKGFICPAKEFELYSEDSEALHAKDGQAVSRHELSVTVPELLCNKASVGDEDRAGNKG